MKLQRDKENGLLGDIELLSENNVEIVKVLVKGGNLTRGVELTSRTNEWTSKLWNGDEIYTTLKSMIVT